MLRKAERCKAKCVLIFPEGNPPTFGIKEGNMHSFMVYLMYLPVRSSFSYHTEMGLICYVMQM